MKAKVVLKLVLAYAYCGGVAFGASRAFMDEYSAVYLLRGTTTEQIERLSYVSDKLRLPASSRTSRDLMLTCGRIVTTAPVLKADLALGRLVRFSCSRVSDSILASAPTNARARAIELLMGAPSWNTEEIRTAQQVAPFEPTPLQIRLYSYVVSGTPPRNTRGLVVEDFSRAMQMRWGRQFVATVYEANPAYRDIIQDAAQNLEPAEQADFLRSVRHAVTEGN